ncbi:gliding motility-associated C-terminal domain-containing protein [Flavihumibacter solisilvae]|nr:gliding motility-associated C-terminal domain-containing protein [Flavihumibacter solisilvae]
MIALFNTPFASRQQLLNIYGLPPENYGKTQISELDYIVAFEPTLGGYDDWMILHGSTSNYARDLETDADDNLIIVGDNIGTWDMFRYPPPSSSGNTQLLIFKIDYQRNLFWHKLYGGSNHENAVAIKKARDGNMIVLAQSQSGDGDVKTAHGGKDIWLLKINQYNGDIMWQKTFGSTADEIPTDLEILPDGSMVISGMADPGSFAPSVYSGKNSFLVKLDEAGNLTWSKVFGGSGEDNIQRFIPVNGGGFASIGISNSNDGDYDSNAGGFDVHIFRHDANGDILWKKQYGRALDDEAGDIVYVPCNDAIFASFAEQYPNLPIDRKQKGAGVGLKSDGTVFFYKYNEMPIFPTMAPNIRGGFLAGAIKYYTYGLPYWDEPLRSFDMVEYGVPLVKTIRDTTICNGERVDEKQYFNDTIFYDTARNGCGIDTLIRTTKIHVINTSDSLVTTDTTLCYGSLFEGASATASFVRYDTTISSTICGPKKIIHERRVNVRSPIPLELGKDTVICEAGISLYAPPNMTGYIWQDGSPGPTLQPKNSGTYWVEVTDQYGCKTSDTIKLAKTDLYLERINDTIVLSGDKVTVSPATNGILTWRPDVALSCTDCPIVTVSPATTNSYKFQAAKDGCIMQESFRITVTERFEIKIPNAFTPNRDGINDVFRVRAQNLLNYRIEIFNRWGQVVYRSTSVTESWDGSFAGKALPSATFTYQVHYQRFNGKAISLKGTLLLIR